jgi:hypothetical protein
MARFLCSRTEIRLFADEEPGVEPLMDTGLRPPWMAKVLAMQEQLSVRRYDVHMFSSI